ncbi:competence type IV pilus minor pilin ComGD [Bacillus sp. Marseille-P3661]|uniref:competence type IV pilus minor pilin ComGD n=1 Tax=Bacillus sp. Marseille-P3661 TaxID=1936234 RepID=UPI000C82F843|nr:competence type IV pilus minor pilin ComGD [Bacillus sp. Marseille-P3661]
MKISREKGFTLLETIVVFSLFCIVISITLISLQPLYRQIKIDHFIEQLQTDVLYAKIYSISHHTNVNISFFPTQNKYYVYTGGIQNNIVSRQYSSEIDLQFATLPTIVRFTYNGNIIQSGRMYIKYHGDMYSVVFLFGKGLTYVSKL